MGFVSDDELGDRRLKVSGWHRSAWVPVLLKLLYMYLSYERVITFLLLDGESFVAYADGKCWVKFVVKQVAVSPERPHGLELLADAS